MSKIIVMNMKDVTLGNGDGSVASGTATITAWTNKAGLKIGTQYKLKSDGKVWVGTCTANALPVTFTLEEASQFDVGADAGNGVSYNLTFLNNSSNAGSIIVFQQDPGIGVPNVFPLAWFEKYTFQTTTAKFTWQIAYNFVWENTGEIGPGVVFSASQCPSADLSTTNEITLDYDAPNQAYNFADQGAGPRQGSLYISQSPDVPLKQAAVGIGMSGAGTFVVQAQPNIQLTFTPHPKYYVAFGTFTAGQVLDIQQLTNIQEVDFPAGVYSMTVVLNMDNTWTVSTTPSVNAALATTRRNMPQLFRHAALPAPAPRPLAIEPAAPPAASLASSNGASRHELL